MRLSEMKLSEKMLARAERMRKRGHRAYAMFLRNDAREVAKLEAENEALRGLEREVRKLLRPNPNFKGTLPSWKPIHNILDALLTGDSNDRST